MSKGQDTRRTIVSQALELSSQLGLEGVSIGTLAKQVGMSKSGLYAHFDSKEDLQCAVLDAAAARFVRVVVSPAIRSPRGVPRVRSLFEMWLRWDQSEFAGGCPFIGAASELDDREGPARDRLVLHLQGLFDAIARAARIAVDEGHFRADLDAEQFAYEFWAAITAFHHFGRLMKDADAADRATRAFENLIQNASR